MGKVFEAMCRQAYHRHHAHWGLSDADAWTRWEGQDRNRRPIELDIVVRLDDGRVLTGEIKWSSQPVDVGIHHDLTRDLEDLACLGQKWAQEAMTGPRLYVSAAGFAAPFQRLAEETKGITLVSLADLYGDR